METRERLATWTDPEDSTQHYIRFLKGTLNLDPNTSNITTEISEAKLVFDELGEHLQAGVGEATNGDINLWQFKVLSLPRIRPGPLVLSMPRPVFRQIQDAWHLHARTIDVFLSNNGVFTTAHCPITGRSSTVWKVAVSRSIGFDCVSLTRDPATRTTYVLYHHLADEASVFAALTTTAATAPERLLDHHFFVATLYQSHHGCVEAFRHVIDMAVLAIERQTRYGKPGRLMDSLRGRPNLDDEHDISVEDPKTVIRQLSYCQTDLAVIGHVARCSLECGEQLIRAIEQDQRELLLLLSSGGGGGDDQEETPQQQRYMKRLRAAQLMTRDDVEYTRRRVAMIMSQVQQMRDRSQSQTSFMLNDLAQSEAEYTAAIAIDTKRDSIAMRTLSVLGIVFLPGTFVATLFSVDMFDWGGEAEPSATLRVSPSMWIYWVIAVPLTVITFLLWLVWSRRENRKSDQRLNIHRMKKAPGPSLGAAASTAVLRSVGIVSGEKMV